MKVLKFGGSSVGSAANIEKVLSIVADERDDTAKAVVLSAMQGTTDLLIAAGNDAVTGEHKEFIEQIREKHFTAIDELFDNAGPTTAFVSGALDDLASICEGVRLVGELTPKTLDRILSFGEIVSTRIFADLLTERGIENEWIDSRKLIRTDSDHGNAAVEPVVTTANIAAALAGQKLAILPGFVAADASGATTTLGRGGSDYTAAIIAAAIDADLLEIWTDVSGMMSADPRFVRNVRHISSITYREAMELSHFGAKVIYPPTIQPVMAKNIAVLVKNTFAPDDAGTLISAEAGEGSDVIRGISSIDGIAVLNLEGSGMVGVPGFSKRLFDALSRAAINVILITQSSSEHSISVAVDDRYAELAKLIVDSEFEFEILAGRIEPLRVETGFAILALVGDNMRKHTGVSGRMFSTLGQNGINIHAIAQGSSERNISAIIASNDVRKAVNTLHEEFFSDGSKQINVFIAGIGNVGRRLLEQIAMQSQMLHDELRLNLRVIGVANSSRASIDIEGIDLTTNVKDLAGADAMDIGGFCDAIISLNLRNSIFVDVTASDAVVEQYPRLLERSISVIACNKVAASSDLAKYHSLRSLAREYNANFQFETNVGAGLPIITTLNDLIRSGDQIRRIDAVLSGTLNFVFNNYDGSRPFADVVKQAQDEGYTEPDPRLDLSGTDVARKILILARESGYDIELGDVEINGFLPQECLAGSVDDFYREMAMRESHFLDLKDRAAAEGKILKYIATFADGRASIGLQQISHDHNFANLSGKDNAVLFYTNRYADQPLVIKGAGAGADVTAAGVFADIIRAAR